MNNELHIVSVSGGKDSTALYCLAVEVFGQNFLPIFADTGNEHPVTVNYVRNMHIMAGGPEVVIVKSDFKDKIKARRGRLINKLKELSGEEYSKTLRLARCTIPMGIPFLDLIMWKGRAPSTKAQFCTEWLKLWPIKKYLEQHYGLRDWVMYTGLRAGESLARSKRKPYEDNTYFDCDAVNPMLYATEYDIFDFLEEKGVPPNPLYALGYGRVGCFPCIHANKKELSLLPDWAWDKLEHWESRIGRSWFGPGTVPGIHIPTIQNVRDWCRTSHGGKQFNMFSEAPADAPACMSTWGHCE